MSSRKRKQERKQEVDKPVVVKKYNKVKPRSKNQRELMKSLYTKDLTFGLGPAGTGKTHLSVGVAIDLLQRGKIEKIVITRPMIEADQDAHGNKSVMGYLPGDIKAKMMGFLRPLYDELAKFVSKAQVDAWEKNEVIEICPLAFTRGRTFENSFIICDEAQNATEREIEMLLTRLGLGSKMAIVGDADQSDLSYRLQGGLENFVDDLDTIEGIGIIYLETVDVARHKLVAAILDRRKELAALDAKPASYERVGYEPKGTERGQSAAA